jgi:hypothetical protein
MKTIPAALAALCLAGTAAAGDWQATIHAGPTFPFYDQTIEFDPGSVTGPGGSEITPEGVYRLEGHGGLALGGALAFHPVDIVGIELRLDTADVSVRTGGSSYRVRLSVPPFGTVNGSLAFTEGEGDLERLMPVSLNLRVRTPGSTRLTASGGVSYLPSFRFAIRQPIGLGIGSGAPLIDVGEIVVPAEALPSEEGDGRWGLNGGVGVELPIGGRLRLVADGRYFWFQSQTLYWGEPQSTGALSPVQDEIVQEITGRLEPASFNPTFFQATAGIALQF